MDNANYIELLAKHGIDSAHPGGALLTRRLLEREVIHKNTMLLDIGCGTGQTSAFIAKRYGCSVFAVDINDKMLTKAAGRFQNERLNIKLFHADAMELPFQSSQFDMVLAESVTVFTIASKSLNEYFRVLKSGGILLDIELTAETSLRASELSDIGRILGIRHVPTQDEWYMLFSNAGFKDVQISRGLAAPQMGIFPPHVARDFLPYLNMLRRYGRKLGYRVYRCRV